MWTSTENDKRWGSPREAAHPESVHEGLSNWKYKVSNFEVQLSNNKKRTFGYNLLLLEHPFFQICNFVLEQYSFAWMLFDMISISDKKLSQKFFFSKVGCQLVLNSF